MHQTNNILLFLFRTFDRSCNIPLYLTNSNRRQQIFAKIIILALKYDSFGFPTIRNGDLIRITVVDAHFVLSKEEKLNNNK